MGLRMNRWVGWSVGMVAFMAGAAFGVFSAAAAQPKEPMAAKTSTKVPLIPRSVIFGNPDKAGAQLSHDGKYISYLAAVDGVMNVFVGPAGDLAQAKPITSDKKRGIRQYFWAYNNTHVLYLQDVGGDENWKVFSVDVAAALAGKPGGAAKDLTPFETIPGPDGQPMQVQTGINPDGSAVMTTLRPTAQINNVSELFPHEILVGLNNRNPEYHDLHRVNITTGAMTLVLKNDQWAGVTSDDRFALRFAEKTTEDGGTEIFKLDDKLEGKLFEKIPLDDTLTTALVGFDKTGEIVYMNESRGLNTSALMAVDVKSGQRSLVAADPKSDVGGTIVHPTLKTIQAVEFNYKKPEWRVLDPLIQPDLDFLAAVSPGVVGIQSRTLDDSKWIVSFMLDNGPARVFLYDRAAGPNPSSVKLLYVSRSKLEGVRLSSVQPVLIPTRDELEMVSYVTLPPDQDNDLDGVPDFGPLPMVLLVHGGPWARDEWGYDGEAQWLANRGYAVLQVNFRGSTGFGKEFINAGNLQWSAAMHNDLVDAVTWAVMRRVAVQEKVAIMGGSYGGYATLVGLTFTPDVFACGVDIVGPSNLVTLLSSIPPYWAPIIEQMTRRVGDHRTDEGRKYLESISPLTFVDRITKPLLIGQGANDPRVKQTEADQIASAMLAKNIPVTYVLFPDEGHGFARPENRMGFYAITEAFLAQHLGGRAEPIGEDVRTSTAQIRAGVEQVPGLSEAKATR
jgi:dipeptidyl aminopeptidase/acylaminoacyl peptidase